jgi:sugar/nucleoside kinase (ribokinase family)
MLPSMSERAGVASVGCVVVDLAKTISALPEPDHLAMVDSVALGTGGPALNMSVNLSQLGAPFPNSISGAVGDDANGAYLRSEFARLGIDGDGVQTVTGVATSFTDVFLEPDGRRTMFYHAGANDRYDAANVDPAASTGPAAGAKILHVGAPGTLALMDQPSPDGGNGWSNLLKRARAAGMHTNMELIDLPTPRQLELVSPCLPHLSSLIINELEAGALTGISGPSPDADAPVDWGAIEAMAVRLVQMGLSTLAVVHFPAGAVAAGPGGRLWRQGSVLLPADEVRSAVGAGDAFAAGVLYGLHDDWSVEESLRLAVASAAACIREAATSAGIKRADECLALAERFGHRPAT